MAEARHREKGETAAVGDVAQPTPEWVDGFLWVGNHRALDLVNTLLVNEDGPVELLTGTDSLVRWLIASGILRDARAVATARAWGDSRAARLLLRDVRVFREQLRGALLRLESGRMPEQFLAEFNAKLLVYPRRHILKCAAGSIVRETVLEFKKPEDCWSEIAGAASDFFVEVPFARVRKCERCVVHFYDISKKGSRRWCSMSLCGNREKVEGYRRRQRSAGGSISN